MRPLSIRARVAVMYGLALILSMLPFIPWITTAPPGVLLLGATPLVFGLLWLFARLPWLRGGLCGTRYLVIGSRPVDYLIPLPTCLGCGIAPGARQTSSVALDTLLLRRFGLFGERGPQPNLPQLVTSPERRAALLPILQEEIAGSRLSAYDRVRLIAALEAELRRLGPITVSPRIGAT